MKEKNHMAKDLEEVCRTLTEEQQRAIHWIIENIQLVSELTEGEEIPKNELTELIEKAKNRKDYVMQAILLYKQQVDEKSIEERL